MNRLIRMGVVASLILGLGAVAQAQVGKEKKVEAKATKARGDAADENIKNASDKNDPKAKRVAPPDKGGPKQRGGACGLHVDNRTQWIVKIYVDGNYRGSVSPYGDVGGVVDSGWPTTVYGRADFDDGTVLRWGPKRFDCESTEIYTWTISD